MMKKLVLKISMVLLGLFAGVGTMRAGIEQIVGSLDVENPTTWFYVNLNAQVSNPGCGTTNPGRVWLLHTQAEPTDKLDNDGNWTCLLDENGNPVPDPQVSGDNPWSTCLHLQTRKAVNPWIPNNPKPAQPECPYTAEYVNVLYNIWNEAYLSGIADAEANNEKNCQIDVNWSDEKKGVARDGYNRAYDWKKGLKDQPYNPYNYYDGLLETLCGYWENDNDGSFKKGLQDAQDGISREAILSSTLFTEWLNPESDSYWGVAREWANKRGYYSAYDWYHDWYYNGHYLNVADPAGAAKPTGFDEPSVSLNGTALVYAPGFEDANLGIAYVSTYAYFYGKVQENDGWYFTGWSYTEGESDLGGVVAGSAENDSIEFRVLPASEAGEANIRQENVYATFQPVRVSDYKVNGLINTSASTSTTITFDVVGQRVSTADFTVSVVDADNSANNEKWYAALTSCVDNKVTVTVTYSGSVNGEYSGNVTLASKSGCSQLTAPVYARVGADASNEATLYDGKTPTGTSGTLLDMIAAANNTDKIVVLNKNYESNLTVNAKATINFNGYTIQDLEVTGGELTVAYSKYGSSGEAVSVTGGKLILNGGDFASLTIGASGIVEQNGAVITGASENRGILITTEGRFEAGLTSYGTLTINGGAFEGETAITVSGGTANINKATITGTTYGIATTGGTTNITSKLVAVYGATNAVKQEGEGIVNLTNGKFDGATPLDGTINLQAGYFKVDGANIGISVPEGKKVLNVLAGTEFAEGYRYFVGDDASSVGVCRIGTTSYTTLEDALAFANNTGATVTIIMTNDYTLPAGYYTLPATATLIVPMSNDQEGGYPIVNRISNNSANRTEPVQPTEFRRLTFEKGVNMDVHGTIELTGTQRASDDAYAAMPHGPYGHLVMEEGSHMTLQNGSLLRAWGYMTGKGETDARRGSVVREQFQMGDWKGGGESFKMLDPIQNQGRVFPISQYFIQNIESPVKYHPGATLSTTTSVSAAQGGLGITAMANDIIVVGVSGGAPAMFFMDQEADAENTWVRKWYDAENDIQTYDVNSGAHIGSMVLDLGKLGADPLKMNSGMFVLPITNNMKIHLLSGAMDFTQVTALLPGAEVEVDKESTVTIYSNPDPDVFSGALIIYDAAQWGEYANGKCIECQWSNKENKYVDGMETGYYTKVVKYSPSWDGALIAGKPANGKPNVRHEDANPADASINVHGTFATGDGYLLTTEGGANIFSSNEDAGTYVCSQNSPSDETLAELYVFPINKNAAAKKLYLAKLKNGNDSYTETTGSIAGMTYMYRDGAWRTSNPFVDGNLTYNSNCFTVDVNMMSYLGQVCDIDMFDPLNSPMNEDVRYAVALVHAPVNIREYLLVNATAVQQTGYTISPVQYESLKASYNDIGGEALKAYLLSTGNPMDAAAAGFVDYIPVFEDQAQNYNESYDFGTAVQTIYIKPQEWVEIAGTAHLQLAINDIYEYEDLYEDGVTSSDYSKCVDAVDGYLDYIESNRMNPTIVGVTGNSDHTYSDAAGSGRLFIVMDDCQWWEVEKKDNLYHCIHPENDTYYFWNEQHKEIVEEDENGDDVISYKGGWEEKRYTITWRNWNGDIIQTADKEGNPQDSYEVTYGTMAEFLGTNPTREKTIDYTYDFTGWSPALGPVTGDVTYTATYTQKDRMYTIIFQNEGGVEIERQFLKHNEIPVCENIPTKVGHTLEWTPAIAAVTGDATYTATWLEEPPTEYEVTFFDYNGTTELKKGNVAVGVVPTAPAPLTEGEHAGEFQLSEGYSTKPATSEFTYVFDHWSPALEAVSATSIKSYTAVYREVEKTYTVRFFQANGTDQIGGDQTLAYGAMPEVPTEGITEPVEAGYTYTYVWENMADASKTVEVVKANANYKPRFTGAKIKYTVKLKSNPSEACTFTGAGIYEHGDDITISQNAKENYTFQNWTNANGQVVNDLPTTVTGDITLTANFSYTGSETTYEITWKRDGAADLIVTQKENTATVYPGATPTKDATTEKTYTFYGWTAASDSKTYKNGLTPKATANETYTAYFNETDRTYTITWANEAGTANIEVDYEQPYGAAIAYNSATPTKAATADYTYTFDGWSTTVGGSVVSVPATVSGDATFYAHFKQTAKTLEIAIDGEETLVGSTNLNTLIITSDGVDNSGQLVGANYLNLHGNADFVLSKTIASGKWYSIAVPWRVEANGGVYLGNSTTPAALGPDFEICYYDGAVRAAQGKVDACWVYMKNLSSAQKVLEPGKAYMIYLKRGSVDKITFRKKAQESILNIGTTVYQYPSGTGDDTDAGWNAIANPSLFHAYVNAGSASAQAQQYDADAESYEWFTLSSQKLVVGEPIYVQAPAYKSVVVNNSSYAGAPARRTDGAQVTSFDVNITAAGAAKYADHLCISLNEDKEENKYVIGQDLVKFGVSSKVAQMWIDRYDSKLCVNTMAPEAEATNFPMSLFAPAAGEYTITIDQSAVTNDAYALYLIYNGEAIWNLSDAAYTLNLNKGTVSNYGLRVSARAPQVVTGVDEAIVDAQGDVRKVLINDQVFIIRGDKVYSIDGQLVK